VFNPREVKDGGVDFPLLLLGVIDFGGGAIRQGHRGIWVNSIHSPQGEAKIGKEVGGAR